MNKLLPSIRTIFVLSTVAIVVYYVLLHGSRLHTSITSIIAYAHTLAVTEHLLVLALLPIYIAVMIFGTAMLAMYIETKFELFLKRIVKTKVPSAKKFHA